MVEDKKSEQASAPLDNNPPANINLTEMLSTGNENSQNFIKDGLESNKDEFLKQIASTINDEIKTTEQMIGMQISTVIAMEKHGILETTEAQTIIKSLNDKRESIVSTAINTNQEIIDATTGGEPGELAGETEINREAHEIITKAQEKRSAILLKTIVKTLSPFINLLPVIGDPKMIKEIITGKEGEKTLNTNERILRLIGVGTGLGALYLASKGFDFSGLIHDISDPSFNITDTTELITRHATDGKSLGGAGLLELSSHFSTGAAVAISMTKNMIPILKSIQPKLANMMNAFNIYLGNAQKQQVGNV